jgi:hypothetical protein
LIGENRICVALRIKKLFLQNFYCIIPALAAGMTILFGVLIITRIALNNFPFFRFNGYIYHAEER